MSGLENIYENWEISVKTSSETLCLLELSEQPQGILTQDSERETGGNTTGEAGHKQDGIRSCHICLIGISEGKK